MKINTLTAAEEALMQLLWELNVFYLKDVMTQHPEPKPHQNTISTYLKILVDKAFLKTEKQGRIFKYSVAVPRENYVDFLLKTIAQNYFNDSPKEMNDYITKSFKLAAEKVEPAKPAVVKPTAKKVPAAKPVVADPVTELVEEILLEKKTKKVKKKEKEKDKEKDKDKKEKDKTKDKKKKK